MLGAQPYFVLIGICRPQGNTELPPQPRSKRTGYKALPGDLLEGAPEPLLPSFTNIRCTRAVIRVVHGHDSTTYTAWLEHTARAAGAHPERCHQHSHVCLTWSSLPQLAQVVQPCVKLRPPAALEFHSIMSCCRDRPRGRHCSFIVDTCVDTSLRHRTPPTAP